MNIFDKVISIHLSDEDYGSFMMQGTSVLYVGHTCDGWWYWVFDIDKDDLEKEDFFETVLDNDDYYNCGYSVAYFDTKEELLKDLDNLISERR